MNVRFDIEYIYIFFNLVLRDIVVPSCGYAIVHYCPALPLCDI